MSDLATMRSNAQDWDKLTDNQKHRLAGADHVKSAEGRANAACRLLTRFGPDMVQRDGILCRHFDRCFEAGDGQRVVALIVRRCQDDPELTRLVRQLSGGSWLDDPRYHSLPPRRLCGSWPHPAGMGFPHRLHTHTLRGASATRKGDDEMTTANQIADGRYVLAPEGSAWVGIDIRAGRIVAMCEEAVHATFVAADDGRADLAPEDDMDEVSAAEAAAIVALWDERCSPEYVAVYRR